MKKIISVIATYLVLIAFSSCTNDESLQGMKIKEKSTIPQSQNEIENSEIFDTSQIKGNISDSPNNEIQSDVKIPYEKSKPLESTTYIEQAFVDFLKNALDNNSEYEVLKDLVSSKLLTKEEFGIIDLSGTEDFLIKELEEGSRYSLYHQVMLVDADNDGIDDIIVYLHSGGSGGFVDLIFYKGSKNGGFEETYSSPFGSYAENAFVKYNDKNYFLITAVDYNRKVRIGFELYCFTDGVLIEIANIQKTPESYTLFEETVISDEYMTLADELSEIASMIYFDIDNHEKDDIVGSTEIELSDDKNREASEMRKNVLGYSILRLSKWYTADIDNDGVYEIYSKAVFWPSNNFTYRHLTPDFFKDSQEYNLQSECELDIWADNRIPQRLWVESVNEKNIICVLSTKSFADKNINSKDEFVIDCYYIKNNTYQTVIKLEFSPNYKTTIEVYTQDINKDFIKESASDFQ